MGVSKFSMIEVLNLVGLVVFFTEFLSDSEKKTDNAEDAKVIVKT